MALEPQAALEQAVVNQLIASLELSLDLSENNCRRMFDGRPPSAYKLPFVAVWSHNDIGSQGDNTYLREIRGVEVTISIPIGMELPWDRRLNLRDRLEIYTNRIIEVVHKDCHDFYITNAAELLAEIDGASQPVGFRGVLTFLGSGRIQEVGPDWYHSKPGMGVTGIAQTTSFGRVTRIRELAFLT